MCKNCCIFAQILYNYHETHNSLCTILRLVVRGIQ